MIVGDTSKYFKTGRCLNIFLTDIRKIPLLTIQEEEELVIKAKSGDSAARDKLISGNLRFIYSIAKIYARTEEELTDYMDEGVIGLCEALEMFDPTRGYKFITYGVWYIRRAMNYFLMTKRDTVSRSAPVGQMSKRVDTIKQRYYAENGRVPTKEEVKAILKESFDIDVKNDEFMVENTMISIDDEVTDDYSVESSSIYNSATACYNDYEEQMEKESTGTELNEYLSYLNEGERDVLEMRFGVGNYERPYSDEEIAEKYHISPARVNKIVEHSLDYIKQVIAGRAERKRTM